MSNTLKSGWMTKQGGMIKTWKKRWFELTGTSLIYFTGPDQKEKGRIEIADANLIDIEPKCKKQPAFKIQIPCVRTYIIVAETEADRTAWIEILEKVRSKSVSQPTKLNTKASLTDFQVIRNIGQGTYGKVKLVKSVNDGQLYAMKSMDKQMLINYDQVEQSKAERNILIKTVHPFLVGAHFTFQNEDKIFMILDYVPGGELFQRLKEEGKFNEPRAQLYAAEILLGLGYLHSLGFIYRDLKPENILVDAEGHLRITDFGLVKQNMDTSESTTSTFCGTPEYIAPEMLQGKAYSKAVDWWSFGILVFELLRGLPPFYDQNTNKMYRKILHEEIEFPAFFSANARNLISRLLDRNPQTRLGAGPDDVEEIKRQPFFAGMDWDAVLAKRIHPQWVPNIASETDTSNFDPEFTEATPAVSVTQGPALSPNSQSAFDGFTSNRK